MAVTFLAGNRAVGTSAERLSTFTANPAGWVELGRASVTDPSSTITVPNLANKRYYMILQSTHSTAQDTEPQGFRFNGDFDYNYCNRHSADGANETPVPSKNYFLGFGLGSSGKSTFTVNCVSNFSTKEKLIQTLGWVDNNHGLGATAPRRAEVVGKWANISNAISSIALVNGSNFATDSQVVVLGYDPADTHTNNFWTELASVNGSGSAGILDSGVFTAKKYLWVQAFLKKTTSNQTDDVLRLGNSTIDLDVSYSSRRSINGGSDTTSTHDYISGCNDTPSGSSLFCNMFIVNVSNKEKLVTGTWCATTGSGVSGDIMIRAEIAGKWIKTTHQANRISIGYSQQPNTYATSSILKVWGSD